jgi:hypothetical protein
MGDFADMRRKMRKPLTEKARELTLRQLETLAPGDMQTQVKILEQSIQRSWQGVFGLKEISGGPPGNARASPASSSDGDPWANYARRAYDAAMQPDE